VITSVQSNLARGHITVPSHLSVLNAFIQCVHWAGTFTCGGCNTLICRYVTIRRLPANVLPQKCHFSQWDLDPM